jgi:PAS domain S-box-containing protein
VLWNKAAEDLFGFVAAQATSLPLEALIPDELRSAHRDGIRHYRQTGHGALIDGGRPAEVVGMRADGSRIPIELTLSPLSEHDRRYVLAIVRDVTERSRAQAEREKLLATAEAALRTRDEFLGTLAHDLKSPLTNLSWHVQMLGRRLREGKLTPAELDDGLQAIVQLATEAAGAIDELYDLTRLASGAPLALQQETIDLVLLTKRKLHIRQQAASNVVELDCKETSLLIVGDTARLSRVLDNLLDNAAKYSPAGSGIRVILERETAERQGWAVLRVEDHGVGVPAADLPHIFDRYRRGANVAHLPGEGLGLSSVRQLIELHGGRTDIQSQEGVGSTFTIRLPLETHMGSNSSLAPATR